MEFKHKSVLLEETIEGLDIKPDGIYVDGTLGGAGHAGEVCRKLSAKGRFVFKFHLRLLSGFTLQDTSNETCQIVIPMSCMLSAMLSMSS